MARKKNEDAEQTIHASAKRGMVEVEAGLDALEDAGEVDMASRAAFVATASDVPRSVDAQGGVEPERTGKTGSD